MANQRKNYYETLEKIQKSDLDITAWLEWFLACLEAALLHAEKSVGAVLRKAAFWNKYREISMNDRQIKMVNLLWDGFEGTKCSADTALRDIQALMAKGILRKTDEGGRSTHYELIFLMFAENIPHILRISCVE